MKKLLLVLFILVVNNLSNLSFAASLVRVELVDVQYDWVICSTPITVACPSLEVTAMDDVNVQALTAGKAIKITVPQNDCWSGIEWRFRIDGSNNDSNQIERYVRYNSSDGNDHWIHYATSTILQGTQEYSEGFYFADTITDTNVSWYHSFTPLNDVNNVARDPMETFGARQFLFICPTITTGRSLYVDYRRWSR